MRDAVAFAVALVCVLVLVPLIRRLCVRWRIFDQPGELKIHRDPIPRLGGVAIVFALAAGVVSTQHGARGSGLFFAARLGWCGWLDLLMIFGSSGRLFDCWRRLAARFCFTPGAGGYCLLLPLLSRLSRNVCS